jgi:hypothetical protein
MGDQFPERCWPVVVLIECAKNGVERLLFFREGRLLSGGAPPQVSSTVLATCSGAHVDFGFGDIVAAGG